MADVPQNQKLWNMLVSQAKTKFHTWPSLPASKWVHKQYVEHGGQFVKESKKPVKKAAGRDKDNSKKGSK